MISRSSVARFRRTTETPRSIAETLHVDALVTGTVRRSGNRIRISVELMDAKSERVLWADRFDRELEDVLRLQDDIARAIAREVCAYTAPDAQAAAALPPRRVVPEVYLLDLRGRRMMESRTEAGFRSALTCFTQALDLDPSYGPSYLGVARAHNMLANYGLEAPRQALPRVRSAIERAREMGADDAEAQGELAQMLWQFNFDWTGADRAYRQALEVAPRNARLWYWHGTMLAVGGRFDAALESLARSEELDPLSPMIPANRGWIHYFARRYDQAVATLREVLVLVPSSDPRTGSSAWPASRRATWMERSSHTASRSHAPAESAACSGTWVTPTVARDGVTRRRPCCRNCGSAPGMPTCRAISWRWCSPDSKTATPRSMNSKRPTHRATRCFAMCSSTSRSTPCGTNLASSN